MIDAVVSTLIEFVFWIIALLIWLIAFPLLSILLLPVYSARALSGEGRFWPNLELSYRRLREKWREAIPNDRPF